jgi:hypothetical protein
LLANGRSVPLVCFGTRTTARGVDDPNLWKGRIYLAGHGHRAKALLSSSTIRQLWISHVELRSVQRASAHQHGLSPIQGEPLSLSAAMATEVTLRTSSNASQVTYSLVKDRITVEFTPDIVPPRGEDVLQDGETLLCVLVSMTYRSSIVGFVLKQVENNIYRRVGRFECYECSPEDSTDEMSEDAEALFEHWFPEIKDMTQLDAAPQRNLTVV